ncbi:MAG: hypothetical protein NTZ51_06135 [Proteobacteria bacterium]|nr:hypothetical protein [Pseudomonadota bacterium]
MGAGAIPIHIEKAMKERPNRKYKLQIYIADTGYAGEDNIDVSFHGGNSVLAPPKNQLFEYKLGRLSENQFRDEYFKFLEYSFIQYQYTWDKILERKRIVLVCSCNADDKTCHRYFLIKFLKKFGAVFKGKLKK